MEQGFIPDAKDNAPKVSQWVEGPPRKRFFGMVKVRGLRQHPVETWRCGRCHYLESYAPGA
jgi:hypothetical protein